MLAIYRRDLFVLIETSGSTGASPPLNRDAAPGRNKNEPHHVSHDIRHSLRSSVLASGTAFAQYTDGAIKIGVLNDMSSLYADISGPGAVAAATLAVENFGAAAEGIEGRGYWRRSCEQAGRRLQHRPQVAGS